MKKGEKMSDEARANVADRMRHYCKTHDVAANFKGGMLGRKHSDATKLKMRLHNLGKKRNFSAETLAKIKKSRTGVKLKRLPKSEEWHRAASEKTKAIWRRPEHRKIVKEATTKFYATHPEAREARSIRALTRLVKGKRTRTFSNTRPERIVKAWLADKRIEFVQQKILARALVDFYIPARKTVVEVDGCFWHACFRCGLMPDPRVHGAASVDFLSFYQREAFREDRLRSEGYKVVTIWEHEIKANDFSKLENLT